MTFEEIEALEGLYAERLSEQVERLAHHAVRGKVWDKALAYCRQAGAKATAQAAYRGAVMAFEQALMALQHLPESRDHLEQAIDLRLDLRHVSAKGSSSRPFRAMDMTFWLPQVEAALAQVEGA